MFIGDAILDFLITIHIMETRKTLSPGDVTNVSFIFISQLIEFVHVNNTNYFSFVPQARSALVNNNTLATICVAKELDGHMLYESPDLFHKIRNYIENCDDDDYNAQKVKQELEKMNEEEVPKLEMVEVPKCLGDLIESLIGKIEIFTFFATSTTLLS